MRFLADENVSRLVIERLRDEGHDVISVAETRPGAPDDDILNAADADDRILITEDRDFGEMVISPTSRATRCHPAGIGSADEQDGGRRRGGGRFYACREARRQSRGGRARPHSGPAFAAVRCCRKARFSSGLIIDRTRNNTLSVAQQAFIMNKHGTKIELWDNLMDLFRKKKDAGKADDTKDKSKKKA